MDTGDNAADRTGERAQPATSRRSMLLRRPRPETPAGYLPQRYLKPFDALGKFLAMALDTLVTLPKRPFAWREFLLQCWFVARVSLLPTLLLAIPFDVLLILTLNILLNDFGAADYSGTGAAWGTVTQVGPVVTVVVISGAAATAMCADLGARTIREELDALKVMGVNPSQALVVPRVLAFGLGRDHISYSAQLGNRVAWQCLRRFHQRQRRRGRSHTWSVLGTWNA